MIFYLLSVQITANTGHSSIVVYSTDPENEEDETDKGSSTDDALILPGVHSSRDKFVRSITEKEEEYSSEVEEITNHRSAQNVATSFVSNESNSSDGDLSKVSDDSPPSNESEEIAKVDANFVKSPSRIDTVYAIRSIESMTFDGSRSSTDDNDEPDETMVKIRKFS